MTSVDDMLKKAWRVRDAAAMRERLEFHWKYLRLWKCAKCGNREKPMMLACSACGGKLQFHPYAPPPGLFPQLAVWWPSWALKS